jgi:hypothetical protein
MKVSATTFFGVGERVSFDFKLKAGRTILFRKTLNEFVHVHDVLDHIGQLEQYLNDIVLATHKAGYQLLATRWENELKSAKAFHSEYDTTLVMAYIAWVQKLNFFVFDEEPIL